MCDDPEKVVGDFVMKSLGTVHLIEQAACTWHTFTFVLMVANSHQRLDLHSNVSWESSQ